MDVDKIALNMNRAVGIVIGGVIIYLFIRWGFIAAIPKALRFITYGTHFNQF